MRRSLWIPALAGCCLLTLSAVRPQARPQSCPTPRATLWSNIRDSLWPQFGHVDGDDRWAHLDSTRLPQQSATWCNPLASDAQAVRAGRLLYEQIECASCHGEQGRGDGPGAAVSDPAPYDFTRPEFAGMREPPGPAALYAILTRGIAGTSMQAPAAQLSGWERLALIAYLTSLPGPDAVRGSRAWADTLRARRAAAGH
jgi:mono/diheme cytochrome c family protein